MAAYLQNHDLNTKLEEDQVVSTYTIGFASDQALLQTTADRGNGRYYTADNASELTDAFTRIIDDLVKRNVTFTGPSVSVNTFNRLTHRDELYFAMFQPSNYTHWAGNLKRYRLGSVDGESAIRSVSDPSNRFDVILLDFPLGGGDRLDVLRVLKRLSPKSRVLLMSADISADDLAEAARGGAVAFIPKPFDLDEVWMLVERYGHPAH